MEESNMTMTAAEMGRKGGKASGSCKVRGDAEYYRSLRMKRMDIKKRRKK
jgi:general stress protein YciG